MPRTSAYRAAERATATRTVDSEDRKKDFSFSLLPRQGATQPLRKEMPVFAIDVNPVVPRTDQVPHEPTGSFAHKEEASHFSFNMTE